MGASLERSAEVRGATWDDFDAVVALLVAQSRAATGIATRPEFVRAAWELPNFQVGRDNWVAGAAGYAAVAPAGTLTLAAADEATADALLARAAARARERGLHSLELTTPPNEELARRHPFVLRTEVLAMWRRLSGPEPEPEWPPGATARTFRPSDASAVHALLDEAYRGWDGAYVPLAHEDWLKLMTEDAELTRRLGGSPSATAVSPAARSGGRAAG